MDHTLVVRQKMTERYLLGELDSEARDEFEEHYFDCRECALDLQAGSLFVEQGKAVLAAETPQRLTTATYIPAAPQTGWLAWLRPASMVPVLALLLAVIGYQNLVTYPRLQQALNSPRVLPWASLNIGTYGAEAPAITLGANQGFLLFVRIPSDGAYSSYTTDLYNPEGKLEWTLTTPATSGQDQWPLHIPGASRKTGTYTLAVHGTTAQGKSAEVGRALFELQIRK
jgi:hypothetical protein